jgi:hypothetical protein
MGSYLENGLRDAGTITSPATASLLKIARGLLAPSSRTSQRTTGHAAEAHVPGYSGMKIPTEAFLEFRVSGHELFASDQQISLISNTEKLRIKPWLFLMYGAMVKAVGLSTHLTTWIQEE